MKSGLAQDSVKSAKSLAQQVAKQIAREPLEILKNANSQVIGPETPGGEIPPRTDNSDSRKKLDEEKTELLDKMKSTRRMEALNRELGDIHKQDLFKDLQGRIAGGEEIPLENYPDLSMEQKQVLKAQMEAVKVQMENAKSSSEESVIEPASKKGRQLFNFGKKQAVKQEQTRVEKPVPPSG